MKNLHLNESDPRPYPVVKAVPRFWEVVSSFNELDVAKAASVTAVGYVYGTLTSRAEKKNIAYVATTTAISGLAGFMVAYQNASGRLMGLLPNADEVKSAGL